MAVHVYDVYVSYVCMYKWDNTLFKLGEGCNQVYEHVARHLYHVFCLKDMFQCKFIWGIKCVKGKD